MLRLRHPDLVSTVELSCPAGHPLVLRCHPVRWVDGRPEPFPTLFWLACPVQARAVANLERAGRIRDLQRRIARSAALMRAVAQDHRAYAAERWAQLDPDERARIEALGMADRFRDVGIGGVRDWRTVKCLHMHRALDLVRDSATGRLLRDQLPEPCAGEDQRDDGGPSSRADVAPL